MIAKSLALATLAAGLALQATPATALVLGSEVGARVILSTHVDGFTGRTVLGGANHAAAAFNLNSGQPANASGSASISGTTLRSAAFAETPSFAQPCKRAPCSRTEASSLAQIWDRVDLTFANDGYNDIDVTFTIDGERSDTNAAATARWLFAYSPNYSIDNLPYNTLSDGEQEYALTLRSFGKTVTLYTYMEIATSARNGGFADFGHTMRFNWGLPPGTTYTSASGVFSESPVPTGVPEPASWALMILGFGGAGAVLRRARAGSPEISPAYRPHLHRA